MTNEEGAHHVLGDHQKIGSRFVPPFVHKLGALGEIRWLDGPLPELFWLALLNERYGLQKGAHLGLTLAKAASEVRKGSGKMWFAPASAFASLTPEDWAQVRQVLAASGDLGALHEGLSSLVGLYPACPLFPLFPGAVPEGAGPQAGLSKLTDLLAGLFDKSSKPATLMQANAVYIAFVTELLVVAPTTSLANFPAVADYPDSEEARRVGAAVRATINGFFGHWQPEPSTWTRYFWNRGLQLGGCISGRIGEGGERVAGT